MGKRIHSGAGSDEFGHANRELRVTDYHAGQELGVEDDFFLSSLGVGDHAGAANLRAGAGGGGHRNNRIDHFGIGAGPPVANILKNPKAGGFDLS